MPAVMPAIMPTGGRFLFRIPNRRGLGHLMRGLNIAQELRRLRPHAQILFYVRTPPPPALWEPELRFRVEGQDEGYRDWPSATRSFAPDVVVYDTTLPDDDEWPHEYGQSGRVYIMRKWRDDRQDELFEHPLLPRMDAVIVPHAPEEFGRPAPEWLRERMAFVGPIVRLPDPSAQMRLRARYGLRPWDFVLTSTCGGGGFEAQAERFLRTVWKVHAALAGAVRDLRHIVVKGPNFARPLAGPPGALLVDTEPDMASLLAQSDLVIAEGGYNTVNEVRAAGTPAVFLPSARGKDDQEERVLELERRGLARVFREAQHDEVPDGVLALCTQPGHLAAMRHRHAAEHLEVGNRRAAERIAELAAWI
jgi:predicted glycosyltransferase